MPRAPSSRRSWAGPHQPLCKAAESKRQMPIASGSKLKFRNWNYFVLIISGKGKRKGESGKVRQVGKQASRQAGNDGKYGAHLKNSARRRHKLVLSEVWRHNARASICYVSSSSVQICYNRQLHLYI